MHILNLRKLNLLVDCCMEAIITVSSVFVAKGYSYNSEFVPLCDKNDVDLSELDHSEHVLRRLCPAHRATQYNLRTRPHPFALPNKDDKNFIPRMMYKNIY